MKDSERKDRRAEQDSFWDLDAMMPRRKAPSPFARDTSTVAITVSEAEEDDPGAQIIPPPDPQKMERARQALRTAERRLHLGKSALSKPPSAAEPPNERELAYLKAQRTRDELEERYRRGREEPIPPREQVKTDPLFVQSYTPEDHSLIEEVAVYRIGSASSDRLRDEALTMHRLSPKDMSAPPVPFSAALPSYSDMDEAQSAWYLCWREQVRRGIFPPTDNAYVSLLTHELLNLLPDPIAPEDALALLCRLWQAYRETDRRLDYLIPEWITDLCLLYRLPMPEGELLPAALTETAIRVGSLKEFFLGSLHHALGSPFAHAVFRYSCHYRYTESRFLTEENRALFDTHIPTAFLTALTRLEEEAADSPTFGICQKRSLRARMVRQTFAGASFSRLIKHRLEVTYLSCTRSIELRFMATDLCKYCENQVRRLLGIKSRFHTAGLDPRLKSAVDAYFAPLFPKPSAKKKETIPEPPPAWEALYEARTVDFSPDAAKKIEKGSWSVTRRLVEAFSDEQEDEDTLPPAAPAPISDPIPKPTEQESEEGLSPLLRRAFAALLAGDHAAFETLARENRLLPPTLAEQMNEYALDRIGDVTVEEGAEGFSLIDDYKEDILQWMNP